MYGGVILVARPTTTLQGRLARLPEQRSEWLTRDQHAPAREFRREVGYHPAAIRYAMSTFILQPFGGAPPSDDLLCRTLRLGDDYVYVTATTALERLRHGLTPPDQVAADGPQLVFHKALRHLMGAPLLTRTEERVTLLRAAREVAGAQPVQEAQIRRDVVAWQEALAELDERGIDPTANLAEAVDELVLPRVGGLLAALHDCRRRYAARGRMPFELTARKFLAGPFLQQRRVVVMEGFTFLRPLQEYFARRCLEQGADVILLYPWQSDQARGFAVMQRTYSGLLPSAERAPIETSLAATSGTALHTLQTQLFNNRESAQAPVDDTVTLELYGHRHSEVAACVRRIQQYLQDGTRPDQVAVVVRDPALESLLQEEAARTNPPLLLSTPPRLLLLTPVGRFALTLYEVWSDGEFDLRPEAFLSLLNSGWLGAEAQDAADPLEALSVQFFAQCQTRADWEAAFQSVRSVRDSLRRGGQSRIPAGGLPDRVLQVWKRTLDQVWVVCERLFAAPQQSIGEHVRWLLDTLNRLAPEELFRREQAVVERIQEALTEASESASMPVSPREFGDVLVALAREYERAADERDVPPDRVWVTTPEGIDNSPREIVLFLGVDNQRVPRALAPSWPFDRIDVEAHAERERYLFLGVVRAASRRLHLSLARHEQDREFAPSPYMLAAARVLGRPVDPIRQSVTTASSVQPGEPPVVAARRREYTLAEIAQFALCPFRYKLERLDRRARHYRDSLQVPRLAVAVWTHMAVDHLQKLGTMSKPGKAARLALLTTGLDAVRDRVRGWFPGLRDGDWATVEAYTRTELESQADFKHGFSLRVVRGQEGQYTLTDEDRITAITVPVPLAIENFKVPSPYLGAIMRAEWLAPGRKHSGPKVTMVEGLPLFAELYDTVQWWARATRAAYRHTISLSSPNPQNGAEEYAALTGELAQWVARIEAGKFPKHPGSHCLNCPVRGECLGLNP